MDDHTFLQTFEAAALSPEEWDHRSHIRMAYLYVRELTFEAAVDCIRQGIQRLNRAHQKPETEFSGYHETITVTWAWLVAAALPQGATAIPFDQFITANAFLLDKAHLWRYYSPPHLLTPQARRTFVAPNRQALPTLAAVA